MKKEYIDPTVLDDHLGCFGNFDLQDPICLKRCAVRLRCAIDRDQNNRLEFLEDLMSPDSLYNKLQ